MRRVIRGRPLLVVSAAAAASMLAGCRGTPVLVDASHVSGNLEAGCASCDIGPRPDTGAPDVGPPDGGDLDASDIDGGDAGAALGDDAGTDGGP